MQRLQAPYPAAPGEEEVDRFICASMATSTEGMYAQMEQIRRAAVRRNTTLGVHAVLLYQSGWFVFWAEGPRAALVAMLERARTDPRHHSMRIVHKSRGRRLIPTLWSMILSPPEEAPAEFGRRVAALRHDMDRGRQLAPTAVFRQLMVPMLLPEAQDLPDPEAYHRVGVCAASGTSAFDLVQWLSVQYQQPKTHRRVAGEKDVDSGSAHVDFMLGPNPCRVIAIARQDLAHGVRRAFLPDLSLLLLLFTGDPARDDALLARVAEACSGLASTPDLLGVAPDAATHARMELAAAANGLHYLNAGQMALLDQAGIWRSARAHLERFEPAENTIWALPESQWQE